MAAEYGYTLSSEEHGPRELVRCAARAEQLGFSFVSVSDHYHPWIDKQGQSPFVWSVVGGVAATTSTLRVGTGVTCPTMRIHPAVIAQAAATSAEMLAGRFFFGVGSGENLNEHILGDRWPTDVDERLSMLEEAVHVIRKLWDGGYVTHEGRHYKVDNARIYTLPERLPPVIVSAFGPKAAALAARIGDGLWTNDSSGDLIDGFKKEGGSGPVYGQINVCWAATEAEARRTAYEYWPTTGVPGQLSQDLALPMHFELASSLVTEEQVASSVTCGPDADAYVEAVRSYEEAGFTHVYLHQIGPDQDGFFSFWERELRGRLGG
jgi:coenzyme F420-dependent glucose-6-phosphate dehydrogenase